MKKLFRRIKLMCLLEQAIGIYFDTDVEVIKSFDDILQNGAFMGCEIDGIKVTLFVCKRGGELYGQIPSGVEIRDLFCGNHTGVEIIKRRIKQRKIDSLLLLFYKTICGENNTYFVLIKKITGIFVGLRGTEWYCAFWFLLCIFVVYVFMYVIINSARRIKFAVFCLSALLAIGGIVYAIMICHNTMQFTGMPQSINDAIRLFCQGGRWLLNSIGVRVLLFIS